MSFKENRFFITKSELAVLNDWLTRLNYDVDVIELRTGLEPGIGHAITAYIDVNTDEGYFKLLTNTSNNIIDLHKVESELKKVSENTLPVKSSKKLNKEANETKQFNI